MKKKILITGGTSMIGQDLASYLSKKYIVLPLKHKNLDLTIQDDVVEFCCILIEEGVDYVIHLASLNGNIQFNSVYPADIYFDTAMIGLNVLRSVAVHSPKTKILSVLSSCSYPEADLLKEENYWSGSPHPSIEAHGFSKRVLMEFGRQIHKQYGVVHVGVCVNTCYGENDNFNIHKTKVIGSLIKKFYDAKINNNDNVVLWGDGSPRREFVYSKDLPPIIEKVLLEYNDVEYPINIGSGIDFTIKEVAHLIKDVVGFKGEIVWDTSKPNGQMKKLLCNEKYKMLFGEASFTPLNEGIEKTVKAYEKLFISNNPNNKK